MGRTSGNRKELKVVQRELMWQIREGENSYRKRMEEQLQQRNVSGVWRGLKTISGYKGPDSQVRGDHQWANNLNIFFNRFDQSGAPTPTQSPLLHPPSSPLCGNSPVTSDTSTQPPTISPKTFFTPAPVTSPPTTPSDGL